MSINFTGDITFKNKLFNVLRKNETGTSSALGSEDTAYVLTAPGSANSGWSFGYIQYDLSTGSGKDLFRNILENAQVKDESGNYIYIIDDGDPTTDRAHDKKVAELLSKSQLKGGLGVTGGLTTGDVSSISQALSSTYGKAKIDDSLDVALQKLVKYADDVKNAASQTDQTFLRKDIARLFLCDYGNQFGTGGTLWQDFVKGSSFKGYQKNGDMGVDDLLGVYFRTKEAQKYDATINYLGANTVLKRFVAVVQEAGGYTPTNLEEAKSVLRAYTYLYVPHESQLLATQARVNNLNDFRSIVTHPANQVIVSNWKPEWGTCPSLSNIDDILMGDDNANMSDSGDYQLNGRDGNDIIFGEGGNDQIKGGKGDDILLGGKGVDKLYGGDEVDHLYGDENNDYLYGEGENDFIYGGAGDDKITGGKGNDYLEGGADNDTYYINAGEGVDTIEDKEGSNHVVINGTSYEGTSYTEIIKVLIKQTDGTYKTGDGKIKGVMENTDMVLYDAATGERLAILNKDFNDGDFGIRLLDAPVTPTTTNTIVGDQNPNNPDDIIYDTSFDDRIEGGAGNDTIMAYGGGADRILGGDGRDAISALTGNDTAEGNAGADIVFGGIGDDQLFGGNYGELEDLMIRLTEDKEIAYAA